MKINTLLILMLIWINSFAQNNRPNETSQAEKSQSTNLIISGIGDGPLLDGTPKFVELYVKEDIADLSKYRLETIYNGQGVSGAEFTFPPLKAKAGSYLYIATDINRFTHWFGFSPHYLSLSINVNGNDAVALYKNNSMIDVFGAPNINGKGSDWDYTNGFAYRKPNTPNKIQFEASDWTFSGPNAWDGIAENAKATIPFPAGTFTDDSKPTPSNSEATPTPEWLSSKERINLFTPFDYDEDRNSHSCCGSSREVVRDGL